MFLSMRGNTEYNLMKFNFEYKENDKDKAKGTLAWDPEDPISIPDAVKKAARSLLVPNASRDLKEQRDWLSVQDPKTAIIPTPYPFDPNDAKYPELFKASVKRGEDLFNAKPSADPKIKTTATSCASCHEKYGRAARFKFDDWGTLVRPNNFTFGVFRGGRRPVDIYFRIHSGINGSNMINFGTTYQPNQIWDLVNFVSSLSYPGMRQKLGIDIN